MLTVRTLGAATFQVPVREGDTIADLKREASKQLGVAWYELQWMIAGAVQCLPDDAVLDLAATPEPEVTSIVSSVGDFPLDSGVFGSLVVHGVTGEPIVARPDEEHNGRLCVSGDIEAWEGETIILPEDRRIFSDTAVVVAEERKLTVIGDADVEQDDAHIIAAWNVPVRLRPDGAPTVLGWRVRYVADGFAYKVDAENASKVTASGPRVGLSSKEQLTNLGFGSLGSISFVATECNSGIFFGPGSYGLACASIPIGPGSDGLACAPRLCPNDAGGFDYDVLVAFDTANLEVRAVVGWGTPGARVDRATVPADLWPSHELDLLPVVGLNCEDFAGFNNVCKAEQLPVAFEALTREQMPDDAVRALYRSPVPP